MIPTAVLMKIATLGLSEAQAEAVAGMLKEVEAATQGDADAIIEKGREKVRARVQKWRAKQPVTLPSVTERHVTAHASASPAPDLENKQTNKEERKQDSAPAARVGLADFRAELSSVLDPEHIEAICAVRRKKGATFSALAGRGLVKALRACPDITAAADEMVLRNWTGIKPDWLESRSRQNSHAPPNGKRQNAVEAMEEIFREKGWTSENEPEFIPSHNGDAECLPAERRNEQGTVVDLRPGTDWRHRPSHQ